jgi:hypothetical protein
MATCVGDVLASMPQLDEPNLRQILRENLCALVRDVAAGNLRAFCDLTGTPGTGVRGWLTGQQLPRPDVQPIAGAGFRNVLSKCHLGDTE